MHIQQILVLSGPNIWSRHPVLEAWVDLEALKDSPSNSILGFTDRLMAWLPSLIEHRCSIGERGGFLQRLRDGTWPGHIMEHVTLELQSLAGTPTGFGKARETSVEGVYKVAVRYQDERVGRAALYAARDLVMAAAYDRPFDVAAVVAQLASIKDRYCLGPSAQAIVDAAQARNIPTRRLNERSFVQLGQGKKQHRTWTAETERTGAIAGWIAQDKELTKSLLRAAGVPVPFGRPVQSEDDAWSAAQVIGLPVVVKPRDANHGRGVSVGLRHAEQVRRAYTLAAAEGSEVLVESFAPGSEHRLLVVGGRVVAAARGDAAWIVGDGRNTVAQLIERQLNSDPRRGHLESDPLCLIELDPVVRLQIEQQGHLPESIPTLGERVLIQRSDNLSIDVTDDLHPATLEQASLAAQVVGLDIAGLDLVCEDVSRPLEAQGGAFVEINAGPSLIMHLKPLSGRPRPVGEAIVDSLFAPGDDGRIPIACVTGTNGKTIVSTLLAHLWRAGGQVVGLASTEGLSLNERQIDSGDCAGPRSAAALLVNPRVEAMVAEAGRGGLLREGLGFDKCSVAVVTNIGQADHLGQYSIDTPEQMYSVKRSAVDVLLPDGFRVLKGDEPLVANMSELGRGSTIFFALDGEHPRLLSHREQGGKAVYCKLGCIVRGEGPSEETVAALEDVPLTYGGRVPFQIENVLAATAAAWALGISLEMVRQGLASFPPEAVPGRFNLIASPQGTVIIDDCHNVSALEALLAALPAFGGAHRTIVYSAGPGRRVPDLIRQGELLAAAFDRVILCHDPGATDRDTASIFAAFRAGLAVGGRVQSIEEIPEPWAARRAALADLGPDRVVVVQADDQNSASAVADVRTFVGAAGPSTSEPLPAPNEGLYPRPTLDGDLRSTR